MINEPILPITSIYSALLISFSLNMNNNIIQWKYHGLRANYEYEELTQLVIKNKPVGQCNQEIFLKDITCNKLSHKIIYVTH